MEELYKEIPAAGQCLVTVDSYFCDDNLALVRSIYSMANNRYVPNGALNPEGKVYSENDCAVRVVKWLQTKYKLQTGGSAAPKFDCNLVMKLINEFKGDKKDSDVICAAIEASNDKFGKFLEISNGKHHHKCAGLSGFFLPYKNPKCKWVTELLCDVS